jgi:CheY-like chemotaxis protein
VQMPGMTGLDLHRHLSASGKPIPTILITAYPDDGVRERALAAEQHRVLRSFIKEGFERGTKPSTS